MEDKFFVFTKELSNRKIENCVCHIEEKDNEFVLLLFPFTGEIRQIKKYTIGWKTKRKLFREIFPNELAYLMLKG